MSLNLVFAEVPYKFNYQGRLRQSGQPVSGARVFQFKIYSALTGGTALWTSSSYSVNVATGVYSVVLDLPETLNYSSGSYYLEIIAGEGAPSVTFSPREQLTSTVYS